MSRTSQQQREILETLQVQQKRLDKLGRHDEGILAYLDCVNLPLVKIAL